MYVWKLFYLITLVWMNRLIQRKYLFWPLFLTSQHFCVHKFSQFWKHFRFLAKTNYSHTKPLHMLRSILSLWSLVFSRIFNGDFKDENSSAVTLPGKFWWNFVLLKRACSTCGFFFQFLSNLLIFLLHFKNFL